MARCPKQADGIEINKVVDGYVVYQPDQDRIHYMNVTAAMVLELCDGQTPSATFSPLIQEAFSLEQPPDDEIQSCLDQFSKEGLIS